MLVLSVQCWVLLSPPRLRRELWRRCHLTNSSCSAHQQWQALNDIGELITPRSDNRKDFIKECQDGSLDGVVAAYRTFSSFSITGLFDEELCKVLPKSWRYLGSCGEPASYLFESNFEFVVEEPWCFPKTKKPRLLPSLRQLFMKLVRRASCNLLWICSTAPFSRCHERPGLLDF